MSLVIVVSAAYLVLLCLIAGLVYCLKPSFMPYHATALGKSWQDLDAGHRALHIGLMRMVGAGFLSAALTTTALTWWAAALGEPSSSFLAGIGCVILFATGLYANVAISRQTGATPPWQGTASGLCAAILLVLASAAERMTT